MADRRPGGRSERVRLAVLHATLDELAVTGYADLTVDAVAERAGVHRTTLYRRWGSAEGLVAEALLFGTEQDWEAPDTGTLEGDLAALGRELVHFFTTPGLSALPIASISAAFQSSRAAESLREFYVDRHARCAVVVDRAVTRGEIPEGTDGAEVIRAATAPVFYRLFISRERVDDDAADTAAHVAAVAAAAGAFVV